MIAAPPDVADYRMAELIAVVHGLLDALGLDRATFVGQDWGALILWHMAMFARQRIEGMKPLVNDLTIHMPDCGRWTQRERPGDVNRLILEWLAA